MIKEIRIDKIDKNSFRAGIIIDGKPRDILINSLCTGSKISENTIKLLNTAFNCALQEFYKMENEKCTPSGE